MESPLDTLIDAIFALDESGEAALLKLHAGEARVSLEVTGGVLISSSLRGAGQTFADFLLESGSVDREDFDRALRQIGRAHV